MDADTDIIPPVAIGTEYATWNVAKFSVTIREQIVDAAKREGCSVADWLHGHFARFGIAGVKLDPVKLDLKLGVKPAPAAVNAPESPLPELASLFECLERYTALRGVPRPLRQVAERALTEAFLRTIPPPDVAPRRLAAEPHSTSSSPANSAV